MIARGATLAVALAALCATACHGITSSRPSQLDANIVDPQSVNAVSRFNSCVGHAYPEQNSPNSGKNYFWGNSADFGTNGVLKEYAACSGTTGQARDDLDANEMVRGETMHLYCDHSSTSLRYFHLEFDPSILGRHVNAGDFVGYASMFLASQGPSQTWQNSPSFDIAVSDGDDSRTQNYFSKLSATAFAAWNASGVTSVSQTIYAGNPVCSAYSAEIGSAGILVFSPPR